MEQPTRRLLRTGCHHLTVDFTLYEFETPRAAGLKMVAVIGQTRIVQNRIVRVYTFFDKGFDDQSTEPIIVGFSMSVEQRHV